MEDDFLMTVSEVMDALDVSRQTLHKWREMAEGPDFRKCTLTGKVRYSKGSVADIKKKMFDIVERCDKTNDMFEEVTEK